jgi:hypothetical protein
MIHPQEGIKFEFIRLNVEEDTIQQVQRKAEKVQVISPSKIRLETGSDVQVCQWPNGKIKRFGKVTQSNYTGNVARIIHPYLQNNKGYGKNKQTIETIGKDLSILSIEKEQA